MTQDPANIDLADIDADSVAPPTDWSPDETDDIPDPDDVYDLDESADD
jgi:hypothetical protein